jgi:two-component system LytT family sensor kinase
MQIMLRLNTEFTKQNWNGDESLFNLPPRRVTPGRISLHILFWGFDSFEAYIALNRVLRVDPKLPPNPDLFWLMYSTHLGTTIILFYAFGYMVVPSLMKLLVNYRATNRIIWRRLLFVAVSSVAIFVAFNIYDYYLFTYATSQYLPAPAYMKRNNDVLLAAGPLGVLTGYTVLSFLWAYNVSYLMLPLLLRIIREAISWGVESVKQKGEIVKQQEEIVRQKEQNQALMRNQLQQLQTQINPHFLFNVFNSLLALIQRTNQEAASLLRKLSELLRYTLYDTDKEFVPLDGELRFLKNYVEIEKTRHFNPDRIRFNQSGNAQYFLVPPLLLVTFIENAFKHGLHNSFEEGWVEIDLSIKESSQTLHISIANSLTKENESEVRVGGIGLKNARNRLDLLFNPNDYKLIIQEEPQEYKVLMTIPLKHLLSYEFQN